MRRKHLSRLEFVTAVKGKRRTGWAIHIRGDSVTILSSVDGVVTDEMTYRDAAATVRTLDDIKRDSK